MTGRGNYIGGQWLAAAEGATFERHNPANHAELIGRFPASTGTDVLHALRALETGRQDWARASPEHRMQVLEKAAELIISHLDKLARDLTREEGKTIDAATMEWRRAAANYRLYAGEALRTNGETFPVADHALVCSVREPVGIVAVITPWNFPVAIPARKIGPALATGNGVIYKPSEVTPLAGQRMVEILLEAGLPGGAIALLQGRGADIGEGLVTHPSVGAVTFTGSYPTGCRIHQLAGPDRRLQLEMGGKNPCIVLADADPDRAAQIAVQGAFSLTGQACTATSNVFVVGARFEEIVAKIVEKARKTVVGNGLEKNVTMGPLANEAQYRKVNEMIALGRSEGLKMVFGADDLESALPEGGHFVAPTVFVNAPMSSRLSQDEIFGPVMCVNHVSSYEEALTRANSVKFGLAASIVTGNMSRALSFARDIEAGVIKVNSATGGVALTAPFGGIKRSSNQTYKEQAGHGVMDFYTRTKTVYFSD